MKILSHMFACFSIFTSLLSIVVAQEVDDESGFSYIEGSPRGPSRWGELREDWITCSNGRMQSPIDLRNEEVQILHTLGGLKKCYKPSNATLRNRGHDIMLEWISGGGSLNINGTKFKLLQIHWHSPSEHAIDGKRFDLEAHMVHESSDGKIAVIGILYKYGQQDKFLLKLEDSIQSIANMHEAEINVGVVDPNDIGINSAETYYRYMGSLTIPPCTEGVVWTVLKKIRTVSKDQVTQLRDAVDDDAESNARPLQPRNNRLVQLNVVSTPNPISYCN